MGIEDSLILVKLQLNYLPNHCIKESLAKGKALRQSILKKAFDGKLLTPDEIEKCKQEADYEPASVLLERIKKEKAN